MVRFSCACYVHFSSDFLVAFVILLHCYRVIFSSFPEGSYPVTQIQNIISNPRFLLLSGCAKYFRCDVDECSVDVLCEIVNVSSNKLRAANSPLIVASNRSAIYLRVFERFKVELESWAVISQVCLKFQLHCYHNEVVVAFGICTTQ